MALCVPGARSLQGLAVSSRGPGPQLWGRASALRTAAKSKPENMGMQLTEQRPLAEGETVGGAPAGAYTPAPELSTPVQGSGTKLQPQCQSKP